MEVWGGNQSTDSAFEMPGLRIHLYSRPFGQSTSGGDVYYLSSCASGRITRLVLSDVCGHGSEVDEAATALRQLMRKNVNFIDQGRLVREVNEQCGELLSSGGFATSLIGTFFSPTSTLTLCNAGHPPPLLYRQKTQQWSLYDPEPPVHQGLGNLPLGMDEQTNYDDYRTQLSVGDLLLCYTDGMSDVPTGSGFLGIRGLLEMVGNLDVSRPETLVPELIQSVASVSRGPLDQDDITVLLVQCTDSRVRMRDNLAAPFRLARSLVGFS